MRSKKRRMQKGVVDVIKVEMKKSCRQVEAEKRIVHSDKRIKEEEQGKKDKGKNKEKQLHGARK